jgi:Rrf2 family protein
VLIEEVARAEKIPHKFLEAILLELKREGILRSKKGKGGGYSLALPADTVTLGRVVRLIDGPLAPVRCVSQTAYAVCADCPDEKTCHTRLIMKDVRDAIANVLDGTTLDDIIRKGDKAFQEAKNSVDFQI